LDYLFIKNEITNTVNCNILRINRFYSVHRLDKFAADGIFDIVKWVPEDRLLDCSPMKTDPMQAYPLRFTPILKQTIWGGRRLATQLNKSLGQGNDYAESWEIVDHGDHQSMIENGTFAGKSLRQLLLEEKQAVFGRAEDQNAFPLLLKYLDCNRVLSVQVHPDDEYGQRMTPPDLGKTEAWYIVESDPDSLIYAGLKEGVDCAELQQAIASGETERVLHTFHPDQGDIVFIPAGTVHALGAGLVVAEIQQSSNTTFRLYDWNRTDQQGNARELHIQESLEVTDYTFGPVEPRKPLPNQARWQEMVRCEKFVLNLLNTGSAFVAGDGQFHILTVPKGSATLICDDTNYRLLTGQSVLLPASMNRAEVITDPETIVLGMYQGS